MAYQLAASLFREYHTTRDPELRKRLLAGSLNLVKYHAVMMSKRGIPIEFDEFVSMGVIGLSEALDKFDPHKGVRFTTYASQRVWGAMIDGLRDLDYLSCTDRSRVRFLSETLDGTEDGATQQQKVEKALKVCTSPKRDRLGKVDIILKSKDFKSMSLSSTSERNYEETSSTHTRIVSDTIEDIRRHQIDESDRMELWKKLINGLNGAQRLIVILYYLEGMTMKEIGKVVGVCQTMVCHMHKNLLPLLKLKMLDHPELMDHFNELVDS